MQLRDAKSVKMEKENLLARVEAQALELANHDSKALKAISLIKSQALEAEQEKEQLYTQLDRVSPSLQSVCLLPHPATPASSVGTRVCAGEAGERATGGGLQARQQ